MNRMPGFTAERALLERTQRHYGTPSVGRSSGSVKPAFQPVPRLSSIERLLCCLRCGKGEVCVYAPGVCACIPQLPPRGGGSTSPEA
jgi:hypothetical protein